MIHKAVAGQSWQRDIIGNNRTYSEHIPNIVRTYPGMFGHERIVVCRIVRRRITCGQARRVPYRPSPDRVRSGSSCAVSPVAGHGVGEGRRVRYRLSPDRVPYDPSPKRVSSCLCPCRRPRCPCRSHGRASGTPIVRHVPAQQPPVADAATVGLRTYILLYNRRALSWRVRRRG